MIGIGRTKLYELISTGDLETIKIGRATLITMRSLRKLIEGIVRGMLAARADR